MAVSVSEGKPTLATDVRLTNLDEALAAVTRLARAPRLESRGAWPLAKVLVHAARSIEYSMIGYPQPRSALFRATLGRIGLRKFLKQGYMTHPRDAGIPGEPPLEQALSLDSALAHFTEAVAKFRAFAGEPAPHFAFGPVTKDEYEKIHAMHVADHLCEFVS